MLKRFNLQHVGGDKEEVRCGRVISFAWLPPLAASGVGAGTSYPEVRLPHLYLSTV